MKHLFFLSLLFLLVQCTTQKKMEGDIPSNPITSKTTPPMETKMTTYRYADGNGNSYIITPTTFEYRPISKMMSSSGTYDGGEPVKKEITEEDFTNLQEVITLAIEDTDAHTDKRTKGSGRLSVSNGEERNTYLFSFRSAKRKEIEKALLLLKQNVQHE